MSSTFLYVLDLPAAASSGEQCFVAIFVPRIHPVTVTLTLAPSRGFDSLDVL